LINSNADAVYSLARDDEEDKVEVRSDHPAQGVKGHGGKEEGFGRWQGSSDDDDNDDVSSRRGEEDPSISSEDGGVDEFLQGILTRKDVNQGVAEARDGSEQAELPPRVESALQTRGGRQHGVPREVMEEGGTESIPKKFVPTLNNYRWGGAIAVPRLPPKFIDPDPVDYPRPTSYHGYQRPRSPTATEYYSAMHHRNNGKAIHYRPHQREQGKVFDLDEWEAAHGVKGIDGTDSQQTTRYRSEGTYSKSSKSYYKIRDSLDAKEKRANEVLAALERAKRSSTPTTLATVALDAGSEDRGPLPSAVAGAGAETQEEGLDGSKEVNLLLALSTKSYYDHEPASGPPELNDDPEKDHRFVGTGECDSTTARRHSKTVANSANDAWRSSEDIENASLSVSSSNESPDSVSSGNKRKDRSGHPKLNQVAVDYLRSWLLSRQHIEQPYPSEQNYADLSRATGLEKPQLKNWFV
jgi:hypothetical protein